MAFLCDGVLWACQEVPAFGEAWATVPGAVLFLKRQRVGRTLSWVDAEADNYKLAAERETELVEHLQQVVTSHRAERAAPEVARDEDHRPRPKIAAELHLPPVLIPKWHIKRQYSAELLVEAYVGEWGRRMLAGLGG